FRSIRRLCRVPAGKALGDRMLLTLGRDLCLERHLEYAASGRGGKHRCQRRMIDAVAARVIVTAGDEKGAAVLVDVAGDVVVVQKLQNAPVLVAVEDDQIELIDFLGKEFARRKRDQRQLIDRGSILLLWRPKNGEMHQIDSSVRLQKI